MTNYKLQAPSDGALGPSADALAATYEALEMNDDNSDTLTTWGVRMHATLSATNGWMAVRDTATQIVSAILSPNDFALQYTAAPDSEA